MDLNINKYVILKWTIWPGYFFTWTIWAAYELQIYLENSNISEKSHRRQFNLEVQVIWIRKSLIIHIECLENHHFRKNGKLSIWVKISFKITKEHLEKKLTPRLLHQRFLLVLSLRHDHHLRQPLRPIRRPSLADLHLQTRILKRKLESLLESKIFFFLLKHSKG